MRKSFVLAVVFIIMVLFGCTGKADDKIDWMLQVSPDLIKELVY